MMSNFFRRTEARIARLRPFFPKRHDRPQVDAIAY